MNPDASTLWRRPQWMLAALLALLSMLGPFSIDTYIPAFSGIARALDATPLQMQQTLSSYLFGFPPLLAVVLPAAICMVAGVWLLRRAG